MATRSRRKRQTRLDFSPLPDSSMAKAAQPEAIRGRVAAVVLDASSPSTSRRRIRFSPLPTPEASSAVPSSLLAENQPRSLQNNAGFMSRSKSKRGDAPSSSMRSSPPSEAMKLRDSLRDRFPSESDSDDIVASSQRAAKRQKRARQETPEGGSNGDEGASSRKKPRRKRRAPRSTIRSDESVDAANADGDDDEDVITITPKRGKRRAIAEDQPASDGADDDNEEEEEEEDNDEHTPKPSRRGLKRSRKRHKSTSDEDQSDSDTDIDLDQDEEGRPARRRGREQDDLKEDLEFLAPSDGEAAEPEDTPRQPRQQSAKKSAKQQALEALRRRRQQSSAGVSSDAPIPLSDNEAATYDVDDEEPAAEDWVYEGAESGDDWIVEEDNDDDDDEAVQIPAEFRLRTAKPKVLFRLVVDWCVQKKINPGFDSRASEYDIAFTRLSDFVNGLGGSKYQSSVWTATFRRGLLARPLLQELHTPASVLMHDRCDACNRSGHPATYEVRFQGNPYNKESLEDFSDDEDETGQETAIPDADRVFYIGKTCMRNARVAHQLHHWRYHLNSWIEDYLHENSYLDAEQVLRRDGKSTRKRGREANQIVDHMERNGDIKDLYRDFKHEIDAAQNGEGAGASSMAYDSD